ncbi:MAG: hypothetical protein ABIW30_00180 [Arenimonas sp.]
MTGLIAQHPLLGGMTWHYLQYILGLSRGGHDAYYVEDSGEWPYNLDGGPTGEDFSAAGCHPNIAYLASVMSRFGLDDRWAYRCPIDGSWHGLSDARRREILRSADLLINVSGTLADPKSYRLDGVLAYIDTDPVFTQIKLAKGDRGFQARVDAHDVHFSFGECLPGGLPETGHHWIPTRQPVVLDEWQHEVAHRRVFSTVMNWASYKSETFAGRRYGQKDIEFARFIDLPGLVAPAILEMAVRGTSKGRLPGHRSDRTPDALPKLLRSKGWHVVDATAVCGDFESYRQHIQSSMAEWTVAKNAYAEGRPGWFSDRSACYLASGRPVVVQDTGFGGVLPVGEGLLNFSSVEEAADGVCRIESDYARHASAARQIAREYFASEKVLGRLIEIALNGASPEVRTS